MLNKIELKDIKKIYQENFTVISNDFLKAQSKYLSDLYKRHNNDLESAYIVLFYVKSLHGQILRKRDFDMNHDISLDNFWNNHESIKQKFYKIADVCKTTGLPKETVRRKIQELLKSKILKRFDDRVCWMPENFKKEIYNKTLQENIETVSYLTNNVTKFLDIKPNLDFKKIILKNFSFFSYHWNSTKIKYMKTWHDKFNDLEMLLIFIEYSIITNQNNFETSGKIKRNKSSEISTSTISKITGIPRATCMRKLEKLKKMKLISKSNVSRKFLSNLETVNTNVSIPKEISLKILDVYSEFSYTVIRNIYR